MQTTKEMTDLTNETQEDDIIALGKASVETKGLASIGEMVGGNQTPGLSDE